MDQAGWAVSCCINKQSPNVSEHNKLLLTPATGPLQVDGGGREWREGVFSSVIQTPGLTNLHLHVCPHDIQAGKGNVAHWALTQHFDSGTTCVNSTHISSVRESCDHLMSKGAEKSNPTGCAEEGGEPQNLWSSPRTALVPKVLCHHLFPFLQAQCPSSPPFPGLTHPRLLVVLRTSYVYFFHDFSYILVSLFKELSLTSPG